MKEARIIPIIVCNVFVIEATVIFLWFKTSPAPKFQKKTEHKGTELECIIQLQISQTIMNTYHSLATCKHCVADQH
jgi:hypothetical protein